MKIDVVILKLYPLYNKLKKDIGKNLFPSLYKRPMFNFLKSFMQWNELIGVEIGTSVGYNAKNILAQLPIKTLYLVDPYRPFTFYDNIAKENIIYAKQSEELAKAKYRLRFYKKKIVFVKKESQDAIENIPDNLDFVYIDGNHEYEYVKRDIELYYSKVRRGGIIGGHDFSGDNQGVPQAVIEFARKNNLELFTKTIDWWFIKK